MAKAKTTKTASPKTNSLYPVVSIPLIKNPNRFYAFPLLGGFVKIVMLIPVFFWMMLLGIAFLFMSLINSFVVLFTGKYWKPAYEITLLLIRLTAKISYFFLGLTNTYPGFTGTTKGFTIEINYPTHPNRLFAFPILGGVARILLLIPYLLYGSVIENAGNAAAIVASFPVLFMGRYPESLYELGRDSTRLNLATAMYFAGLSDIYPSFWISMKHKGIKILFIILGLLYMLFSNAHSFQQNSSDSSNYKYQYTYPSANSTY